MRSRAGDRTHEDVRRPALAEIADMFDISDAAAREFLDVDPDTEALSDSLADRDESLLDAFGEIVAAATRDQEPSEGIEAMAEPTHDPRSSLGEDEACVICGRLAPLSARCPGCGAPPCGDEASNQGTAAKMSPEERPSACEGYVAVSPPPAAQPGSSAGIHCNHGQRRRDGGCPARLELSQATLVQPSHEDDYHLLMPALNQAAALLGWRVYQGVWWCPTHVAEMRLACAQCLSVCHACSCPRGGCADAVDEVIVEITSQERV